jgi:hypothetical protein
MRELFFEEILKEKNSFVSLLPPPSKFSPDILTSSSRTRGLSPVLLDYGDKGSDDRPAVQEKVPPP